MLKFLRDNLNFKQKVLKIAEFSNNLQMKIAKISNKSNWRFLKVQIEAITENHSNFKQ